VLAGFRDEWPNLKTAVAEIAQTPLTRACAKVRKYGTQQGGKS